MEFYNSALELELELQLELQLQLQLQLELQLELQLAQPLASAKAMCYNNAINANAWKTNDKTAGELTRQKP